MKTCTMCCAYLVIAVLLNQEQLAGADWPMFGRDNTRNAVSPEKDAPIDWDFGECHMPFVNDREPVLRPLLKNKATE